MPILPSVSYVAAALSRVGTDKDWEHTSTEEQTQCVRLAKVALDAIWSWIQTHKPDGSDRYNLEPIEDGYAIYDKIVGSNTRLGVVHDALLAQQIIDDLNNRDVESKAEAKGPIYGD